MRRRASADASAPGSATLATRDIGRRRRVRAPEVLQMPRRRRRERARWFGLGLALAATGQAILLNKASQPAATLFALCSYFRKIRTFCQAIFLIFIIAYVRKSRIIDS